jgi:DNA-binding Lrp family transcriptional regulator
VAIIGEHKKPKRLGKSAREVIDFIEVNPRTTAESLSTALHIPILAAKKRIQRLRGIGAVSVQLVVAPEYSRLSAKAFVLMTIAHNMLRRKKSPAYRDLREFTRGLTRGLSKTREWMNFFSSRISGAVVVKDAYSVAGGGLGLDVIVLLHGTDETLLREFVTEVLARLEGVVTTNTAAIANSGG